MESYISLGGTMLYSLSLRKNTPLYKNGIKENQNRPMKTT